jgi:hypothetical protein
VSAVGGTASATAAISASTRGTGSALEAISANASPAIYTKAGTGSALRADGPVVVNGSSSFNGATTFSRSGTAVVAGTRRKPRRAVAVTGVNVSKHSRVLATIQGDAGAIGISGVIVNPSKHSLTINLTGRVTRSVAITWLVLG